MAFRHRNILFGIFAAGAVPRSSALCLFICNLYICTLIKHFTIIKVENKHNTELRGTAPSANIMFYDQNCYVSPLGAFALFKRVIE